MKDVQQRIGEIELKICISVHSLYSREMAEFHEVYLMKFRMIASEEYSIRIEFHEHRNQ